MRRKTKYVAAYVAGLIACAIGLMALFFAAAGQGPARTQCDTDGFNWTQCQGKKIKSIVVGEAERGITLTFTDGTAVLFGDEYYLEIKVKKERPSISAERAPALL